MCPIYKVSSILTTDRRLLMGPDGGFSTGSDFLMDGATAAYWYGDVAEVRAQ
jgi:hypothetical protein